MDTMPRISIIILNWNGWEDTIECLESVYQIKYPNYDVIVIDNGSENESIEKIKEYAEGKLLLESSFFKYSHENKPIRVTEYSQEEAELVMKGDRHNLDLPSNKCLILISNPANYGFAEGNNIGIRYCLTNHNPDYILLLNNDTVVEKSFLDNLIPSLSCNDHNIGIFGPKIYYYDYDGRKDVIWSAGGFFNMWSGIRTTRYYRSIDCDDASYPTNVDFVSGAALLIHRDVVKTIGLLDPDYFTYTEDVDLCCRAKKNGYHIEYLPSSVIWHKVSMSTGAENSAFSQYLIVRNSVLFMRKNASLWHWPTYLTISCCYLLRRMLRADAERRKSMMDGILWHIKGRNRRDLKRDVKRHTDSQAEFKTAR